VPYGASAIEAEHRRPRRQADYSSGWQGEPSHCLEWKAVRTLQT
jgi:hypothetical protein